MPTPIPSSAGGGRRRAAARRLRRVLHRRGRCRRQQRRQVERLRRHAIGRDAEARRRGGQRVDLGERHHRQQRVDRHVAVIDRAAGREHGPTQVDQVRIVAVGDDHDFRVRDRTGHVQPRVLRRRHGAGAGSVRRLGEGRPTASDPSHGPGRHRERDAGDDQCAMQERREGNGWRRESHRCLPGFG